jgi:hypothetical protein
MDGNAGCPAMVRYGTGQWCSRYAEPELAGHLTITDHVPVARRGTCGCSCLAHARFVDGAQPMTDEDRAELMHRREQERLGLAGRRYERGQPSVPSRVAPGCAGPVGGIEGG